MKKKKKMFDNIKMARINFFGLRGIMTFGF